MVLKHTSEKDFSTKDVEFDDDHYDLATDILDLVSEKHRALVENVMVSKDEKSLIFGVKPGKDRNPDRVAEENEPYFRVTVEKCYRV